MCVSGTRSTREVFVPLVHPPGHAQVDFGEALGEIGGVVCKLHYFAMALPHSDALFIKAFPGETTEAFCDGHVSAFAFFGGVPLSMLYDNTTIAVAKICGDGKRERTITFSELQSHYLFEDRFGRPGKGNDKGHVEGVVGLWRRNYLGPMPRFESFEALNAWLEEQCLKRQDEVLRGHDETIGQRLLRDLDALMVLPSAPYDACEKISTRATSISMVRYRCNDYSVPVAYAHHEVHVRGYVDEVVIGCGAEEIARHPRSYEKADMVFDPMHFLALLEQKVGALDQAAPLQGWDLPDEFTTLRRLLEGRMGKKGKREYVQVLRLLETFEMGHVHGAVRQALDLGAMATMRSSISCRAGSKGAHRGSISISIPTCPGHRSRPRTRPAYMSLMSGWRHDRHPTGSAAASSQEAPPADVFQRVRQAGPAVCGREQGPCAIPATALRT